jgi:hypothetical protein
MVEPGRSSRSSVLRKPAHAVASGLVQRKRCDASSNDKHALTEQVSDRDVSGEQRHTVQQLLGQEVGPLSTGDLAAVQMKARDEPDADDVHRLATEGILGSATALPFLEQIQRSFGAHNVSDVQAHIGGAATRACEGMGAKAYATGNHVAFQEAPDLHTAAHEAAHVVQQRAGVQLAGGVGKVGDEYEQNADLVADAVVAGKSAEVLLGGAGQQDKIVEQSGKTERSGNLQALQAPACSKCGSGDCGCSKPRGTSEVQHLMAYEQTHVVQRLATAETPTIQSSRNESEWAHAADVDDDYDAHMHEVMIERVTRPVQARAVLNTGYGDLFAMARSVGPRRPEPTGMPVQRKCDACASEAEQEIPARRAASDEGDQDAGEVISTPVTAPSGNLDSVLKSRIAQVERLLELASGTGGGTTAAGAAKSDLTGNITAGLAQLRRAAMSGNEVLERKALAAFDNSPWEHIEGFLQGGTGQEPKASPPRAPAAMPLVVSGVHDPAEVEADVRPGGGADIQRLFDSEAARQLEEQAQQAPPQAKLVLLAAAIIVAVGVAIYEAVDSAPSSAPANTPAPAPAGPVTVPSPSPPKQEEKKETCADMKPNLILCGDPQLGVYDFRSEDGAFNSIKRKGLRKEQKGFPAEKGPCVGRGGWHTRVKADGEYIASIVCCPCCDDSSGKAIERTKCRVLYH